MDVLQFVGIVSDGVGKFKNLRIPGRGALPTAPSEWPETLKEGSLNIRIVRDGHPVQFRRLGLPNSVVTLDRGLFQPEFEIGWQQIRGNTLTPTRETPRHGDAQVWRAELRWGGGGSENASCWAFRRFGSQVGEQLEFVSPDARSSR